MGIDTSTKVGALGLYDSEKGLIAEHNLVLEKTHSERLMPLLEDLLQATDFSIRDIDGFAVAVGPGSFTGTRIGVTTAKTLAQLTNKPLVGLSTLEVTADNLSGIKGLVYAIFDARNRRVYSAGFHGDGKQLKRISADLSCTIDELLAKWQTESELIYLVGDGLKLYMELIKQSLGEKVVIPNKTFWLPRGGVLARMGCEKILSGDTTNLFTLTPNYLKPAQAEINWQKKHGKQVE